MKRLILLACLLSLLLPRLHAQVIDATVCDILKNPAAFNGKMVRIKGTVSAGFDFFFIKGEGCGQKIDAIWLAYPEGTKAKSGPLAMLTLQPAANFAGSVVAIERTTVTLERNKDFNQFDSLLAAPYKASGLCLGCARNEVSATLVGRLDGTQADIKRDASRKVIGIDGFGNLNAYNARLVLQSVSEVSAQELQMSNPESLPADEAISSSDAAHHLSQALHSSIPFDQLPKRAIDAFGAPGEDNGVNVGFVVNEASASAESKSSHTSPDGVLYNCAFDGNRLKGDSMGIAMMHLGEHVADIRDPEAGNEDSTLFQLEYRGWFTTMFGAIAKGQKNLTLPGGYVIWDSSWNKDDLNFKTDNALSAFLKYQQEVSQ